MVHDVGPPLELPPSLTVAVPERDATYLEHRQHVLKPLGFQRFAQHVQAQLEAWLDQQARRGTRPDALFEPAENHWFDQRVLRPGPSVLERLLMHVCSNVHVELFATVCRRVSPELRQAMDQLWRVPDGAQRSALYHRKAYPPAPSISSRQSSRQRYHPVAATGIDDGEIQGFTPAFLDYFFTQAKRYSAQDRRRFADHKR
jgi:hypothetical protein